MLKFIQGNGNRNTTEYECPVTFHNSWSDALKSTDKKSKFYINPEKFAKMCKFDPSKVNDALDRIRSSILSFCQSNQQPNSSLRQARVNSNRAIIIENYSTQASNILTENFDPNVQSTRPTPVVAFHTGAEFVNTNEDLNGQLHLLLATRVEPASPDDIENLTHGLDEDNITIIQQPYQDNDLRREYRVRLVTPDGQSTVVPYREIQGRILADTGSTTTLIDEGFATAHGLHIESSPYRVILRDVNNGEQIVSQRCYLRLTLTTITGSQVVVTILALCVPNLSHDLLLGTKDLERYQVSVSPHMGQARMSIGNEEVSFPMLNDHSITQLQNLSRGNNRLC
jgi:hypothetical protein